MRALTLRQGLSASEVISGYELATTKALEILETLTLRSVEDIHDAAVGSTCDYCGLLSAHATIRIDISCFRP